MTSSRQRFPVLAVESKPLSETALRRCKVVQAFKYSKRLLKTRCYWLISSHLLALQVFTKMVAAPTVVGLTEYPSI